MHLTATPSASAVTYEWSGPAGFASTLQNPVVNAANSANAGIYTVTVKETATGCTALATATAVILQHSTGDTTATACDSFDWYEHTGITASTDALTHTFTNANGCDSVVTLHLTVNPSYPAVNDSHTMCQGETYTWQGHSFGATAGVFMATENVHTALGCDSVVTMTVMVNPSYPAVTDNHTMCQGETYTWQGHTFGSTAGTFTETENVHTALGCDSIVTMTVTVNPSYPAVNDSHEMCQGETYTWQGHTFGATAGTFTETENVHTSLGCDSIVTMTVTVNPSYTGVTDNHTMCQGETYTWQGHTFGATAGTFTETENVHTTLGCDSIVTMTVTVNPSYPAVNDSHTMCQGETYTWQGHTFGTTSGVFTETENVHTALGCDSVVTMTVTVNPSYTGVTDSHTMCQGDTYTWQGHTFGTTSGTFTETENVHTTLGCDSIVTMTVTVNPSYPAVNDSHTMCQGETYTWQGHTFGATAGTFTETENVHTTLGCDSIVTMTVTVNPSYLAVSDSHTMCQGETYTWHGHTFGATAGTFTKTENVHTALGCDSVVTMTVTVNPSYPAVSDSHEMCQGETYTWQGHTFGATAGVFTETETLHTANGCDSIVTMTVTVKPSYPAVSDSHTMCQGETYTWQGHTFGAASGTFTETENVHTTLGCDSIVTMTVTVNPSYNKTDEKTICENELPYSWNGITFTAAGTQTVTLETVNHCDSVVTMTLNVLELSYDTLYETVTIAQVVGNGNQWTVDAYTLTGITSPGIYKEDFTLNGAAANGCDSIEVVVLTVDPCVIALSVVSKSDELCGDDGSVTVSATGGYAPVQYSIDGVAWQASPVFMGLSDGTYNVYAKDSYGCEDVASVTIDPAVVPSFTLTCPPDVRDTLAFGDCVMTVYPIELGTPTVVAYPATWPFEITNDIPADNLYAEGDNTVTYTLKDLVCGTTVTCEQHVVIVFPKCPDAVDCEGNVYHAVRIDCECWTQRNLESTIYGGGCTDPIPCVYEYNSSEYPNTADNVATYGRLYCFEGAVRDSAVNAHGHIQGICPDGWYLPTPEQYESLFLHGGYALKTPDYWLLGAGNNSTGFSWLPAGIYNGSQDRYEGLRTTGRFWSTAYDHGEVIIISVITNYYCDSLETEVAKEGLGCSIRCIKEKD